MRKAQVEFIVILALVFVIVVVVYYASQGSFLPSPIPSPVFEEQKLVQNSVINQIRKGTDKTLEVMETHGGYLTQEMLDGAGFDVVPYTIFTNDGIPFWASCNEMSVPSKGSVRRMFELSVSNYIKNHISEIGYGKNVSFDLRNLSVSSNILRDKIEITVNLPTKVNGYRLREPLYPYKTSIPTKFGEIYSFARDFANESAHSRFFEIFTINSIFFSQTAGDGYPKLPTVGILTRCGETIYRTPEQISFYMVEIVEYVLTHMLWWQPMIDQGGKPETKIYSIESVSGNKYADLDVRLYLPDNFGFDIINPILITNSKIIIRKGMFTVADCLTYYDQTYSVVYPVVVKVDDPLTGYDFNFAVLVFVDEEGQVMKPGNCEYLGIADGKVCDDLQCSARLEVVDEFNKEPIEDAIVIFGKCVVGYTDRYGIAEGPIDCGVNGLQIYHSPKYEFYNQNVSSDNINGTYELHRVPNMTVHFRKVDITKEGYDVNENPVSCYPCSPGSCSALATWKSTKCDIGYIPEDYVFVDLISSFNQYIITNVDADEIPPECDPECLENCQNQGIEACKECLKKCKSDVIESVSIDYIPGGNYDIDAMQLDIVEAMETGTFKVNHDIRGIEKDVYVHIPQSIPDYNLDDQQQCLTDTLINECGINPFSEEIYVDKTVYASCGCASLNEVIPEFRDNGCITQQEIDSLFCTCPVGSSYPSGCGLDCGGDAPDCTSCCDRSNILYTLKERGAACGLRLVCK